MKVEALWRFPVKSMRGEALDEAFIGFSGVYGDRCYAIHDSTARPGFPYLTASRRAAMLQLQPRFRSPARAAHPPNLTEATAVAPGATPSNARAGDLDLDVRTPEGDLLPIDSPELLERLAGVPDHTLSLLKSDRSLTDCRPLSLISMQTVRGIQHELDDGDGQELDPRRFRANIYLDLDDEAPFAEDALVGRELEIGPTTRIAILERDPRCRMISLDPDTGAHHPGVLRAVAQARDGCAGVYAAVLVEGVVHVGDAVRVVER